MSRLPEGGSHSPHVVKIFQEGGSDKKKGRVVQAGERRQENKLQRKLAQGRFQPKKKAGNQANMRAKR